MDTAAGKLHLGPKQAFLGLLNTFHTAQSMIPNFQSPRQKKKNACLAFMQPTVYK
jgi:hypothetical protein